MKPSRLSIALLLLFTVIAAAPSVSAQRRDYMTEQEIEIVRDAQDIDTRVEVLTRMIDRRFAVLGIEVNGWKDAKKVSDVWGDLPKGTRGELFVDVKKLLQKAVDDIDNIAAHPNAAPIREKGDKEAKKDPMRFPASVRNLSRAAARYLPALKTSLDATSEEREKGPILDSIDLCDQILEAVGKLHAEVKEEKKTKN